MEHEGMSGARKRGLVRLAVLVIVVAWLVVLIAKGLVSGGSNSKPRSKQAGAAGPPTRLKATRSALRLPRPLHGAAGAPSAGGLLVIGGADRSDVSTDQVIMIDPAGHLVRPRGALIAPAHDAAAVTLGGRTLVFGGGASTTLDTVQRLVPSGRAAEVGHLPATASDLSAAATGGVAYVAGGYDGSTPLSSILRIEGGGGRLNRVGTLPTAVRYSALASIGGRIYAFGGELADGSDTNEIQEYDPATHRASIVGRLRQPVSHASALVLGGAIFMLGGRRNGAASAQILRFDPSHGGAVRAGRLPAPVFDAAAGVVGGVGYLAGGIGAAGTSVDSVIAVHP
jgi:Kelch motif